MQAAGSAASFEAMMYQVGDTMNADRSEHPFWKGKIISDYNKLAVYVTVLPDKLTTSYIVNKFPPPPPRRILWNPNVHYSIH
jgi:hypothetical protein